MVAVLLLAVAVPTMSLSVGAPRAGRVFRLPPIFSTDTRSDAQQPATRTDDRRVQVDIVRIAKRVAARAPALRAARRHVPVSTYCHQMRAAMTEGAMMLTPLAIPSLPRYGSVLERCTLQHPNSRATHARPGE